MGRCTHPTNTGFCIMAAVNRKALVALVADRYLASHVRAAAPSLEKILPDQLQKDVRSIIDGSPEDADERAAKAEALTAGEPGKALPGSKTPALDKFTLNLTERAK